MEKNPNTKAKHSKKHKLFYNICCCKEFCIVCLMFLGIFMFVKRDECIDIKRDIDLKLDIQPSFYLTYTNHTTNSWTLEKLDFITWILTPNYLLGIYFDPTTGNQTNAYPDPVYYHLNNYFWKTSDFLYFEGNKDSENDARVTYAKNTANTTKIANVFDRYSSKLLSWTVQKYLRYTPELYYFTKIVSSLNYKWTIGQTTNIHNTGRYYKTGEEVTADIIVNGISYKYDFVQNCYQAFI